MFVKIKRADDVFMFSLCSSSGSTVAHEVFDSESVIMPISWCVVAVTLPTCI